MSRQGFVTACNSPHHHKFKSHASTSGHIASEAVHNRRKQWHTGHNVTGLMLQVHSNGPCLDDEILADPEVQDAIKNEGKVHREFDIVNTDRATLGRLGGAIAKQHGDSGFAGQISIDFKVFCTSPSQCITLASPKSLGQCSSNVRYTSPDFLVPSFRFGAV